MTPEIEKKSFELIFDFLTLPVKILSKIFISWESSLKTARLGRALFLTVFNSTNLP